VCSNPKVIVYVESLESQIKKLIERSENFSKPPIFTSHLDPIYKHITKFRVLSKFSLILFGSRLNQNNHKSNKSPLNDILVKETKIIRVSTKKILRNLEIN